MLIINDVPLGCILGVPEEKCSWGMIDNDYLGVIKTFLAINLKKLLVMQFIGIGPIFNLQMILP